MYRLDLVRSVCGTTFAINALSSRSFAEVEFWFASIKVITIIAFIILGGQQCLVF